jgi:adenosylmethionine-8-amino-7-oxononanoate aminotransferase
LYGHSYTGNPLGAAVAREVLAIYRDARILDGIAERSERILGCFERLSADPIGSRIARNPRGIGGIGACDLIGRPTSARGGESVPSIETTDDLRETAGGYTASVGWRVYDEAKRRGAYLRPLGDVVYVVPPLNIPLDDLDRLLEIVEESVLAVAKGM